MENFEGLKNKLIQAIQESSDRNLILHLWELMKTQQNSSAVLDPQTRYDSERPMTDQEVDEYFAEEKLVLPSEILEILKLSEEQIKNGQVYTGEEVEKHFEEWLKD
ncbi:MAG: hypothetical protein K0M56_05835 [Kaistella sp.]|nr:hypothetical protein [Kaistella sp.]